MSDEQRSEARQDVAALELVCDLVEGLIPGMPSRNERETWLLAVLRLRRLKVELAAKSRPQEGAPWN